MQSFRSGDQLNPSELPSEISETRSRLISLVIPAYNEASILAQNLEHIAAYLQQNRDHLRWEIVIVNDGSRDDTGRIAADFARQRSDVTVVH
ncbi:MAG: glycosyltransferase, partial [Thermosynechococcaceae cyanobacterium]